jgi:hypothetical protein
VNGHRQSVVVQHVSTAKTYACTVAATKQPRHRPTNNVERRCGLTGTLKTVSGERERASPDRSISPELGVFSMKKSWVVVGICMSTMVLSVGPASAFSTKNIPPIRQIPVSALNDELGSPGVWATDAVYTRCGAIGVDAVFYNSSSNPKINTGQQTYSISIERYTNHIWVQVKGSEIKSYRPSHQHHRYEYDQYLRPGWHYIYRVFVANHTHAPLLGTMWVNAAANDYNPADHDIADCQ